MYKSVLKIIILGWLLTSTASVFAARYIKVSNDGKSLADSAVLGSEPNEWACTYDTKNKSLWEVKSDDGGIRDKDWRYSWYNPNEIGSAKGEENSGKCELSSLCNTDNYKERINSRSLCGHSQWEVPTLNNLKSIVYCSSGRPSIYNSSGKTCLGTYETPVIDKYFFKNGIGERFWSSDTYSFRRNKVNVIHFGYGYSVVELKDNAYSLRLVHRGLSFTAVPGSEDTTPDPFSFPSKDNVEANKRIDSTAIIIKGFDGKLAATISQGGGININGGDAWPQTAMISSGDSVKVRHTSSANADGVVTSVLTVGGVEGKFTTTTKSTSSSSITFSIEPKTGVGLSEVVTSKVISVSGIVNAVKISITQAQNAEYSLDGGKQWTDEEGGIDKDGAVWVRHTSAASANTETTTDLTIGGVTKTFISTTAQEQADDNSPKDFNFEPKEGVDLGEEVISEEITVEGINIATLIRIRRDGEYRINKGSWTSTEGMVNINDRVQVRVIASKQYDDEKTVILTIGDKKRLFSVFTKIDIAALGYGYINGNMYDACSGESLDPSKFSVTGGGNTASILEHKNGIYSAKLVAGESQVLVKGKVAGEYKDNSVEIKIIKDKISFLDISMQPKAGCSGEEQKATTFKAIILAGSGPEVSGQSNHIWFATKALSEKAYDAFSAQGYTPDNIYYLTADKSGSKDFLDSVAGTQRDVATKGVLKEAITEWASDVEDVVIYIAALGETESFWIDSTTEISAHDFKQWLDTLQTNLKGRVTVILESSFSASFMKILAEDGHEKRYLISSTKTDQFGVIGPNQTEENQRGTNSFSYFFLDEVGRSGHLHDAFRQAKQAAALNIRKGAAQKAVLDANGDGNENSEDFKVVKNYCFGQCKDNAPNLGTPPRIVSISPTEESSSSDKVSLSVDTDSDSLVNSWVTILPPPNDEFLTNKVIGGFPQMTLDCEGHRCEGVYDNFTIKGTYRFTFFTEDNLGNVSLPRVLSLKQTQGDKEAKRADIVYQERNGLVSIQDIEAGGQHYWVELQQTDKAEEFKLKDFYQLPGGVSDTPATLDGTLNLPCLYVYDSVDQYYHVELNQNKSGHFIVGPESIKVGRECSK